MTNPQQATAGTVTPRRTTTSRRSGRVAALIGLLVTVMLCVLVTRSHEASADAGFGSGHHDVTTDGFTHPWLGGYLTDVGTAWCIESGRGYPRASGNVPAGDLPAQRGVSSTDRDALSYALWAQSATADATTAAALAVVVHGLSGDEHASVDIASMHISDPEIAARAVAIAVQARARAERVSDPAVDPWRIVTELTPIPGSAGRWDARTTVTTATGRPVTDHPVGLVPYNVTDHPATEHVATTDADGVIHTSWTIADPTRPIIVDAQTTAPMYYSVWQGPDYPAGTIPQRIVTPNGTIYRGHAQGTTPTGRITLVKTTDNPAYQSAAGATFDVIAKGVADSVGTLTVRPDGTSEALVLPVGDYVVTETSAPAGVQVDTTPYPVTVTDDGTATLTLTDPVERRAALQLVKVDAVTGDPLGGASLLVEYDSDADGSYDATIGTFTSGTSPIVVPSMPAGDYRITEVAPPPGYELAAETVQEISIGWDQTAAVTFVDHRSLAVTTLVRILGDADDGDEPEGPDATAHAVVPIGHSLADTVTVSGLAAGEDAHVEVGLYGPFDPTEPARCDAETRVFEDAWPTTGSGTTGSGSFTPDRAGRYTWVATLEVPGVGTVSGPCGEVAETALLVPTIRTTARPVDAAPDAPEVEAVDEITVTGPTTGTGGTLDVVVYGPFADGAAILDACASGELGDPVGRSSETFVATGPSTVVESSPIVVPRASSAGRYTFVVTLHIPGLPPIGHDCGDPAETFTVAAPPPPSTTTTITTTVPPTTTPPPPSTSVTTTTAPPPTSTSTSTTTTVAPTTTMPPPTNEVVPTTTLPPVTAPAPTTTTSTTTVPSTSTSTSSTTTIAPTTTVPVPPEVPPSIAPNPPVPPAIAQGVGGSTSPELARTGADSGRLVGIGSALVLAGTAVLMLVARRRRTVEP